MKELSLNILDITMNCIKAAATRVTLELLEEENRLTVTIADDGCGMDAETVVKIRDPFYTTRTTRKVGLGVPFYVMAAQQTGGDVTIESRQGENHGTCVTAVFYTDHIDCMPLGNMTDTVLTLIQGSPDVDFEYSHRGPGLAVELSTAQIRAVMGDIPLDTPEVLAWIRSYLEQQYSSVGRK